MMKRVEKAGLRALRRKRNPAAITAEDFFTETEAVRKEFAQLINVQDHERIAIIPSVSYGISTVAKNIKVGRGDEIVVASEQFPSNYYPWQTLCSERGSTLKPVSPEEGTQDRGKKWNEKILDSINPSSKVVAIAHTHWADGTRFDLEAIRKRTKDVGAVLIVDGTQSVGAMPFDVTRIQPDALICAAYKWLLGPYSIGVAYFGDYFDNGKPLEESWINRLDSENFSGLINYQSAYKAGASRYSMGEQSNFNLLPMLLASLTQINKWKASQIQEYCSALTDKAVPLLREKGFWTEDKAYRGGHLFGIRLPKGVDLEAVKKSLMKDNIFVSFRGDSIRVSPNVYNDEGDILKLVKSLKRHVK